MTERLDENRYFSGLKYAQGLVDKEEDNGQRMRDDYSKVNSSGATTLRLLRSRPHDKVCLQWGH